MTRNRQAGGALLRLARGALAVSLLALSCSKAPESDSAGSPRELDVWALDTSQMEPRVGQLLEETRGAIRRNPGSAEAWYWFAAACDAHKLFDYAVPAYRRASALAPDEFRIVYSLAVAIEQHGGSLDEVVALLERAARLDPDYPAVHLRLGDALARAGRLPASAEAYTTAVRLDPRLARAHRGLGQVALGLGDVDLALEHLEQAAALASDDGPTTAALAQAYALAGEPERASEAARLYRGRRDVLMFADPARAAVLELGRSSMICRARAAGAMRMGAYERAVRDLLVVLEVDSDDAGAHYQLGYGLEQLGRRDDAMRAYRRAVELDPDSPAQARLARLSELPR